MSTVPPKNVTRCQCQHPKIDLADVRYKRGSGLADLYCSACGNYRLTKALDDLTTQNRARVRFAMRKRSQLENEDDDA